MSRPRDASSEDPDRLDIGVLGDIQSLLGTVLKVPRMWAAIGLLLAVASTITIARDTRGDYGLEFRVTWITAVVFALVWLPAFLRVTSLVGGGVKASGVEASTVGLVGLLDHFSATSKREVLPSFIAALDSPTLEIEPQLRELRDALEGELVQVSPDDAFPVLEQLADGYEELRKGLPPGDQRTFLMTRVVAEARAAAARLRLPEDDARHYFADGADGKRIVALAIIQAHPSAVVFNLVEDAIDESRSAFEQFHALRALDGMLGHLSPMQRGKAREVLQRERAPGGWITKHDPSRWDYSSYLLEQLSS